MPNVWIFQSNPKIYNLFNDLDDPTSTEGSWTVRQHSDKIKKGDIAFLWISGADRGIYAMVDLVSNPELMTIDYEGWESPQPSESQELMVEYRYRAKFKKPLLESENLKIPGLSNLSIIRNHVGTNFKVTDSEWKLLLREIKKRGLDGSHTLNLSSKFLELMKVYSRDNLRKLFQIADATINNGIFKPKEVSSIWIFITEEKTVDRTQYRDYFDGQTLYFEGQTKKRTDSLIINHEKDGNEIIVFYRKTKNEFSNYGFRYLGRFYYNSHISQDNSDEPTKFELIPLDIIIDPPDNNVGNAVVNNNPVIGLTPEKQGRRVSQTQSKRTPNERELASVYPDKKVVIATSDTPIYKLGNGLINEKIPHDNSLRLTEMPGTEDPIELDATILSVLRETNKIILNERKVTTYKFALLRGAIDLCRDEKMDIIEEGGYVFIPFSLLIEKWIQYYFPIFSSEKFIPQAIGESYNHQVIGFRSEFRDFYEKIDKFGLSYEDFLSKLYSGDLNPEIEVPLFRLYRAIYRTIIDQPMRHYGRSVHNRDYSIFDIDDEIEIPLSPPSSINQEMLKESFGLFFFKKPYYLLFQSNRESGLLHLPLLRTVRESFDSYGSSTLQPKSWATTSEVSESGLESC